MIPKNTEGDAGLSSPKDEENTWSTTFVRRNAKRSRTN
ncbi:hypothetical protein E24_00444 [Faustovirus]|nr:hypothetical protein E24_00444 [Faustovirus]AMN84341.1 hypothetical protein D5a_00442 [Faustovirus]AMN85327.1 hypothetical protein E23_00444 [Faustovirus]